MTGIPKDVPVPRKVSFTYDSQEGVESGCQTGSPGPTPEPSESESLHPHRIGGAGGMEGVPRRYHDPIPFLTRPGSQDRFPSNRPEVLERGLFRFGQKGCHTPHRRQLSEREGFGADGEIWEPVVCSWKPAGR